LKQDLIWNKMTIVTRPGNRTLARAAIAREGNLVRPEIRTPDLWLVIQGASRVEQAFMPAYSCCQALGFSP